jgi:HlyD family secretion protein
VKTILGVLFTLVIAGGAALYYGKYWNADPPPSFRTVPVKEGDLTALVSATGTLEPEEVVDVGAQVTGPIASRGTDPKDPSRLIDYDSEVEVGTLLAKVDDTVYKAQYDQAEANRLRAQADLGQFRARLAQCEADKKRADGLRPMKAIADADYDVTEANYKAAVANLEVGKATVKQSEAALTMAKRNLDYCTIRSPWKGVIIDRRVNVGQTVVSAMSATSLFLIAKDLKRLQVWASVNEADIGRILKGMLVTFTVDAYPGETFQGTVYQIRKNATMTQNVVTYTVVVATDNSDLRLYPYLTANVSFQVEKRRDVLKIPNGVLRWKPRPEQVAPEHRESLLSSGKGKGGDRASAAKSPGEAVETKADAAEAKEAKMPSDPKVAAALKHAAKHGGKSVASGAGDPKAPKTPVGETAKPKAHAEYGQLWIKDGLWAKPVKVRIGITDGIETEVSGKDLTKDMEVIIGEQSAEKAADMANPFGPPKLFNKSGGAPKTRP